MEASEKPQLSLDEGSVRAIGDRLVIERLEVADERAARVVRERAEAGQPPPRTVQDAIEIGARVLEREGLATEVDYVQREFERTAAQVRELFTDRARTLTETVQGELERVFGEEGGVMGRALDAHAEELAEQISRHFGDESTEAVQHRVRELVEKTLRDSRDTLIRHLSSEDGANPLADFKTSVNRTVLEAVRALKEEEKATREKLGGLQAEVVRLTEQAEAKRRLEEAEEAGTRKGRTFEERVHALLERIAAGRGDIAHHVGDISAEAGGKKGDTIVEIGAGEGMPAGKIAFEAKTDRSLTRPQAWRELNGAIEKRGAGYAVMVAAAEESVPSNTKPWIEYEGNKMIVSVDRDEPEQLTLEAAYAIARSRVLTRSDRELQIDAAGVRDSAQELLSELKQLSTVKKHLTGVTNSAEKARGAVTSMEESMRSIISRIDEQVAPAVDPD
jgi:hypothetical protein